MEAGLREIADAAGMPLILYLKSEDGFGSAKEPGLDAIGRLIDDGVAIAIKYAVVRDDPRQDAYLDGLLRRVDRTRVISGMGERPAVVHLRDFGLGGLTTGSGCIAPALCSGLFAACGERNWTQAERAARATSCRSRISATPGARRACCTTRPSWPASRRQVRSRRMSLRWRPRELDELAPVARALRERDA